MRYKFLLFVAGDTPNARVALANANAIVRRELGEEVSLEVVDIVTDPKAAFDRNVIATPTLVREHPLPVRKVIGDLSDQEQVLLALCAQGGQK